MTCTPSILGSQRRLTATIATVAVPPVPINATVVMKVKQPDGTIQTLSPLQNPSTGSYYYDYTSTQIGWHEWEVLCTGAVVQNAMDRFLVSPATF